MVSHYESTPDASDSPICAVFVVIAWVFVLGPDVSDYSPNSDQIEPREGVAWRGRSACRRITASLVAIQSILRQSKQKKNRIKTYEEPAKINDIDKILCN